MAIQSTLSVLAPACLLAIAAPGVAVAHNYTYVEGGFISRDTHRVDDSGLRIAGAFAATPQVAAIGEFTDTGDLDQLSVGAIYHTPVDSMIDLYGGATLEFADYGRDDDTGFGLRTGLRWKFAQHFELNPEIRHTDVLDHSDTSLRLAGLFNFAPNLSAQAALQGGDDDRFEAGLRYDFAR